MRLDEGAAALGITTLDGGGIRNATVRSHRPARPHRADLACRAVANSKHEIELGRIVSGELVPRLVSELVSRVSELVQQVDGIRMKFAPWADCRRCTL